MLFSGAPDRDLSDIDLLGTIGKPLPVGVSLASGPHTKPAFRFRPIANVGRFARYIFPKQFLNEFSISLAIRPKRAGNGVVFAVLEHYRQGEIILGLDVQTISDKTKVRLFHTSDSRARNVFQFTVPDLTGKWTFLAFSVRKDGITFYLDCKEAEKKFESKPLKLLRLPANSALYIGRAGWTLGSQSSAFVVRLRNP